VGGICAEAIARDRGFWHEEQSSLVAIATDLAPPAIAVARCAKRGEPPAAHLLVGFMRGQQDHECGVIRRHMRRPVTHDYSSVLRECVVFSLRVL